LWQAMMILPLYYLEKTLNSSDGDADNENNPESIYFFCSHGF